MKLLVVNGTKSVPRGNVMMAARVPSDMPVHMPPMAKRHLGASAKRDFPRP